MIYLLLILFQIKHFLCDFPLQTPYMLGKFKSGTDWILPLLAHASVHGVFTFFIALCVRPHEFLGAVMLGLLDLVIHFTVDRLKADPKIGGRFKALSAKEYKSLFGGDCNRAYSKDQDKAAVKSNTYFWYALGADQFFHHCTHYLIIWELLR